MCRKLGCESAWWSRTGRLKMCTLDPRGCPEIQKSIAKGIPVIQGCSIALRGFQHGLVCCKVIGLQRLHTGLSVVKRCLRLVLPQQPLVLLHNCSVHNQPHVLPVRQLQHTTHTLFTCTYEHTSTRKHNQRRRVHSYSSRQTQLRLNFTTHTLKFAAEANIVYYGLAKGHLNGK